MLQNLPPVLFPATFLIEVKENKGGNFCKENKCEYAKSLPHIQLTLDSNSYILTLPTPGWASGLVKKSQAADKFMEQPCSW